MLILGESRDMFPWISVYANTRGVQRHVPPGSLYMLCSSMYLCHSLTLFFFFFWGGGGGGTRTSLVCSPVYYNVHAGMYSVQV